MMRTRKVSALVPAKEHAELTKLAKQHGTTVGELVAFGARLSTAVLKIGGCDPALAPDHRRKGAQLESFIE